MRDLNEFVLSLGSPSVVVVGDVMLDRYVFGSVSRVSPEAPIPVLHVTSEDERPGGAASAASDLAGLGARVRMVGYVGADSAAETVRSALAAEGVDASGLVSVQGRPTSLKTRMVAGGLTHRNTQQMVRVDREDARAYGAEAEKELIATFDSAVEGADCVVISDYAKGLVSERVAQHVIRTARTARIPVLVDPKGNDYSRYRGATLITPNRPELHEATGVRAEDEDSIRAAGERLLKSVEADAVIVTLDKDGMALVTAYGQVEHLRTKAREVYDVTGAGDMVLAALAMVLGDGGSLHDAMVFANLAASVEVAKIGAVPVSRDELLAELGEWSHHEGVTVTIDDLHLRLASARSAGKKVVFTNGCFDILHAGHVRYLAAARREGDILVVGLNSDGSVRRLKGPERPVNHAADRAEVLAALESVDYVVMFAEDTPLETVRAIQPDVLVKGEDWRERGVVGTELVEARGGRVVLIPLLEGRSTSGVMERIREQGAPAPEDPS